jgi:hypothetical protein
MRKLLGISPSAKPVRCLIRPSASPDLGHSEAGSRDAEHTCGVRTFERIRYRTLSLAAAFVVCLSGLSGFAATYYVGPAGSDLNLGTALLPWKTIQKGANTAAAGDTVLVQTGVYDERVTITRPGITFRAENAYVTNRATFWVQTGTTIDGFHLTCDGSNTVYRAAVFIAAGGVTNAWIINNRIHDTPVVHTRGVIEFETINFVNTTRGCVISNNMIYNFGGNAVTLRGTGHLVANNWISNSYGADCFNVQGNDHVFRENYSTQIGFGIANVWGAGNSDFNGPYLDDTARRRASGSLYNMWTNRHGYHIVKSEGLWRSKGWSNAVNVVDPTHTHVYASSTGFDAVWKMHDTSMVSPFTGGIGALTHADYVESIGPLVYPLPPSWGRSASNIVFEGNMIIDCPLGSIVMIGSGYTNLPGPSIDWTFRNNVWAGVEVTGTAQIPYTRFYNNTFYNCAMDSGPAVVFGLYHTNYYDPRGMALYNQVKSNAFIGCGRDSGAGWYAVTAVGKWETNAYPGYPMSTVLTNCDYNYVGEIDGTPKSQGTGYPSPDRYRFSEPHGINGGPVNFVNPAAGDFRIGAGSVLTNGGLRIGAYAPLVPPYTDRPRPPARPRIVATTP